MRGWMLDGDLLGDIADPYQVDPSRTQVKLTRPRLQCGLRDHLPQNRIHTHGDALGRHNSDRPIVAIDFNAKVQ